MKAGASFDYTDMPCFPKTGVKGHSGRLIAGRIGRTEVLILSGRAHFYEGYSMAEITFPIRVLHGLGIEDLVVTNAAGGIDKRFRPGDFMLLKDHVNLMGANPLRPERAGEWDGSFLDLSTPYDPALAKLMKRAAKEVGLKLRNGVYAAVCGPTRNLCGGEDVGADRCHCGRDEHGAGGGGGPTLWNARCGSLADNERGRGVGKGELSHTEVLETGHRAEESGRELIRKFCKLYGSE